MQSSLERFAGGQRDLQLGIISQTVNFSAG
jgi:hypothetical protein